MATAYYYTNLFPIEELLRVFGDKNREFAFEYENSEKKLYYKRYQRITSKGQFLTYVSPYLRTVQLGAIYDNVLLESKGITQRKELTFDVDLTDYDDLRNCSCKGKKQTCESCWKIARANIRTMDFIIREFFGFKKLLFTFSGGRGFHLRVFDEEAATMGDDMRASIVSFFDRKPNRKKNMANTFLVKNHIRDFFEGVIKKDEILAVPSTAKILDYCWPRLDAEVTLKMNHLMKCPFSLHATNHNKFAYILTAENDYCLLNSGEDSMTLYKENVQRLSTL